AHIKGTVEEILTDRVVVETLGGVGYELFCSNATLRRLKQGESAKLLTHFHISQDAVAVYGFISDEERTMFRRLISVTRVGPKLALSVLSTLSVSDIALAIMTENAAAFDAVSGMGRKTAARVLLELKEKMDGDVVKSVGTVQTADNINSDMRTEATAALMALGYDGMTAAKAIAAVNGAKTVQELITMSLREIAKRGSK
ncbi:MAG: Holliday junction branch migration protein RuvA, partial [Clostridia bacterium]|nr:Holliday junction branch migration protein RuvA [Clostridia bacterium]